MSVVRYYHQLSYPVPKEFQYLYLQKYEESVTVIKQKGENCVYVSSEYVEECFLINEYSPLLYNRSEELHYCTMYFYNSLMPGCSFEIK